MLIKSPAKINLFLHILGKRADDYHNLQTVFRLINFYDELEFIKTNQTLGQTTCPIQLNSNIVDNPEDNLIVKAARALIAYIQTNNILSKDTIQQLPCIQITLQKNIPMGAGLGGGSSNCATTLMTLNQLWQIKLTHPQLQAIGKTLGADVAFFIYQQDAIAEGLGEIFTPISLPKQQFLLLMPQVHIATAKIFAHQDLQRDCLAYSPQYLQQHQQHFLDQLSPNFSNVFEPVVKQLSPKIQQSLDYLHHLAKTTQTTPRMSGSGSCVFLPLPWSLPTMVCQNWLKNSPCPAMMVESLFP